MAFGDKLREAFDKLQKATVLDKSAIKEAVKDIQRELIASDISIDIVLDLSKRIEEKAFEKLPEGLSRKEHIIKATYDLLIELLGGQHFPPEKPKKILLCGLFGSGKTTATTKLAKWYFKRGNSVGVICADTFRAAAFEQLQQNAQKANIPFFGLKDEKNAAKVASTGMQYFKDKNLIIIDSAGRSALDDALVKEIKEIHSVVKPDFVWLVLSADIGQVAKKQAIAFHEAVNVNGVIITKMDGSAKGGGALAACAETKAPVYFIGVGEKIDDLQEFDAQRFLGRVMGYGDLQTLLEKSKEVFEEEEFSPEDLLQEDFTLKTFYQQLQATKKIGTFGKIAEMIGLKKALPEDQLELGEEKMKTFQYIMDSMTEQERKQPDLLNANRIKRIAKGAGRSEGEVRELLKNFKRMKRMFEKFKKFGDEKSLEKLQKMDQKQLAKFFGGKGMQKKKMKFKLK